MHDDKTKLVEEVAHAKTVIEGVKLVADKAKSLIAYFADKISEAIDEDDTDALNSLAEELRAASDGLGASGDELAAAVLANTPADPVSPAPVDPNTPQEPAIPAEPTDPEAPAPATPPTDETGDDSEVNQA